MKTAMRILFLFFMVTVSVYGYLRPGQTWDVLGYIGAVLSYDGHDKRTIHQVAYQSLQTSVPPAIYDQLTKGNEYRTEVATSVESFYQQLPIYRMKPLYPILSYLVSKTSLSIYSSTVTVSLLAFCFSSMIIFIWLEKKIRGFTLLVVTVSLVLSANLPQVGRLSTPDSLSGALLLGTMYFLWKKKAHLGFSILASLAILARPDNIILISLLLVYFTFMAPPDVRITLKQFLLTGLIVIGTFVLLFSLVDSYGWETLFYHAFVKNLHYPATESAQLLFSDYGAALARGVRDIVFRIPFNSFSFFVLLTFSVSFLIRFNRSGSPIYAHQCYLMLVGVIIHFVLFPNAGAIDRFSIAQNSIIGISFLLQLSHSVGEASNG